MIKSTLIENHVSWLSDLYYDSISNLKFIEAELKRKEESIKKLSEVNSNLYNDIKELSEEIQSQDKQLSGILQDWSNNKDELDEQTKEVTRLKEKVKLMEEMNAELMEENTRLKKDKCIEDLLQILKKYSGQTHPHYLPYPIYNPPYVVTCSY
jgi:chromosome segregation ATPase